MVRAVTDSQGNEGPVRHGPQVEFQVVSGNGRVLPIGADYLVAEDESVRVLSTLDRFKQIPFIHP